MTEHHDVFLSYSSSDRTAADALRLALEKRGLSVFHDHVAIREGDGWLQKLQDAVDSCGAFVVLAGRDGLRRWVGAETQVALRRHFDAREDGDRLPLFPVLLPPAEPPALPPFLRLFQATRWDGEAEPPPSLLDEVASRRAVFNTELRFEGCPFVGLDAYKSEQAELFFGRQRETLEALACFDARPGAPRVRWLEVAGASGSGKSSLVNAGLLPLIERGWLWPRTGIERFVRLGPMMPGENPALMLAETLARAFRAEMADVDARLRTGDDAALAKWLRGRKHEDSAFLLVVDQFEELFTFAGEAERERFDRLLATALADADCPLYVLSTVRADLLERYESLPALVAARNRLARTWTLPPIDADGLREVIEGPARLAGLDVGEVKAAMLAEARGEPGALPLVQNALRWLWEKREDGRLSGRQFTDEGGLAGILSRGADALLDSLGPGRGRALEVLFALVNVDTEGRQHTRQRLGLAQAVGIAGGGERGRRIVGRLAGERDHSAPGNGSHLRLVVIGRAWAGHAPATGSEEQQEVGAVALQQGGEEPVDLIHETLVRSKGIDARGEPIPYWPTLWNFIEQNRHRAARRRHLRVMTEDWQARRGLARLGGLAGLRSLRHYRGLAQTGSAEERYLRWSRRALVGQFIIALPALALALDAALWLGEHRAVGNALGVLGDRWAMKAGWSAPPLPELATIPTGEFLMGSTKGDPDEQPVHPVFIREPFLAARTETTRAEYAAFCQATGRTMPGQPDWEAGEQPVDSLPVVSVSWHDARAYARWLDAMTGSGCRLPSEAEWEYAARAGTTTEYWWGDDVTRDGEPMAVCDGCGSQWDNQQAAPVTRRETNPANRWDLRDMHGNVWEWVEDCWHSSYEGAPDDASAWLEDGNCAQRALRGGSWCFDPHDARAANRLGFEPGLVYGYIGFRVVCASPIEF